MLINMHFDYSLYGWMEKDLTDLVRNRKQTQCTGMLQYIINIDTWFFNTKIWFILNGYDMVANYIFLDGIDK